MAHESGKKVAVAMSGGVDSSVAAAILVEAGYDVVGVSIDMFSCHRQTERSCCSAKDRMDARMVCERLGIPHVSIDRKREFNDLVMCPFVFEYVAGRTPSPCIVCNRSVKFPAVLFEADRLGVSFVATGHYARVKEDGGRFRLLRATDDRKDQSYFLFGLGQGELKRIVFPLGEMDKKSVRAKARELGFANSEKKESQEVCFVPDDDYASFVEARAKDGIQGPGDFVDSSGMILGRHQGIYRYTIGQRRGLGGGSAQRRYVTAIDAARNRVVLGPEVELMKSRISVRGLSWIDERCARDRRASVKVRSAHEGALAQIEMTGRDSCTVTFDAAVRAPAPGQAAVFYDGDEVLGGGWIE